MAWNGGRTRTGRGCGRLCLEDHCLTRRAGRGKGVEGLEGQRQWIGYVLEHRHWVRRNTYVLPSVIQGVITMTRDPSSTLCKSTQSSRCPPFTSPLSLISMVHSQWKSEWYILATGRHGYGYNSPPCTREEERKKREGKNTSSSPSSQPKDTLVTKKRLWFPRKLCKNAKTQRKRQDRGNISKRREG